MKKPVFVRRSLDPSRVAAVEEIAAQAPIVGDPRIGAPAPAQPTQAAESQSAASVAPKDSLAAPQDSTPAYEVGKIYDLPLGLYRSNPVNPRAVYTLGAVSRMAKDLAARGQLVPASGYVDADGKTIVLIEGETRLRGAREASLPTLRVEIHNKPESDRALYEHARAANVVRNDQTPLDDAIRWRYLLDKGIYKSQVQLAAAMQVSEATVSRMLSLATLPTKVIHVLADTPELQGLQMMNALREYFDVAGEDETIELMGEVVKAGMGYRDVVARRQAFGKEGVKRPRSFREPLVFRGAKGELKTFEDGGRMELVLKGLAASDAEEIAAKIKALFTKE
jgi:ParB family chromosome partitioning protein